MRLAQIIFTETLHSFSSILPFTFISFLKECFTFIVLFRSDIISKQYFHTHQIHLMSEKPTPNIIFSSNIIFRRRGFKVFAPDFFAARWKSQFHRYIIFDALLKCVNDFLCQRAASFSFNASASSPGRPRVELQAFDLARSMASAGITIGIVVFLRR